MNKIRISAVSYTNTKPFLYGIERSSLKEQIELSLDIPSECAAKLIDNRVDIGLIPVAAIPLVPDGQIISDYCIGSEGAVNSVFIFSNVPAREIKTLKLDPQSRTSNGLAKVLLKFHWKTEAAFTTTQNAETDAIVLIGDRTFGIKGQYNYAYDMGQEWLNFTGLPFVYAAWVANKHVPESFIRAFDDALKAGLDNRKALLAELPAVDGFDLEDYLLYKLNFNLTARKKQALSVFLSYLQEI